MDNLVAELAALGLKRLIPLSTQRSVVKTNLASPKFTRWKRIVIESVKQSQGNHLMEIIGPRDVKEVINQAKDYDLVLMGILHVLSTAQYSVNSADYLPEIIQQHPAKRNILYLIGPEGDFTPEEVNLAMNAGIKPVILPVEGILRIETAVVAMLVMLLYAYYPQSLTG
jgi:16S rRNA (uracil1498-N3)-methyltransferase